MMSVEVLGYELSVWAARVLIAGVFLGALAFVCLLWHLSDVIEDRNRERRK